MDIPTAYCLTQICTYCIHTHMYSICTYFYVLMTHISRTSQYGHIYCFLGLHKRYILRTYSLHPTVILIKTTRLDNRLAYINYTHTHCPLRTETRSQTVLFLCSCTILKCQLPFGDCSMSSKKDRLSQMSAARPSEMSFSIYFLANCILSLRCVICVLSPHHYRSLRCSDIQSNLEYVQLLCKPKLWASKNWTSGTGTMVATAHEASVGRVCILAELHENHILERRTDPL